jgi:hypothetical protein
VSKRKNTPTHGRRLKAHPAAAAGEPNAITPEGWARALVYRGLATVAILDNPRPDTPNNRTTERRTR